jgi:hypothetical protein
MLHLTASDGIGNNMDGVICQQKKEEKEAR